MNEIWMDVKVAARRLRRSPGFVLTVVVSLTMAIAANLVALGVLRAMVVGPVGMAAPEQLWQVGAKAAGCDRAVVSRLPRSESTEQCLHGHAGLPDGCGRDERDGDDAEELGRRKCPEIISICWACSQNWDGFFMRAMSMEPTRLRI